MSSLAVKKQMLQFRIATSKHGNQGLGRPKKEVEGEEPYRVFRYMSGAKTSANSIEEQVVAKIPVLTLFSSAEVLDPTRSLSHGCRCNWRTFPSLQKTRSLSVAKEIALLRPLPALWLDLQLMSSTLNYAHYSMWSTKNSVWGYRGQPMACQSHKHYRPIPRAINREGKKPTAISSFKERFWKSLWTEKVNSSAPWSIIPWIAGLSSSVESSSTKSLKKSKRRRSTWDSRCLQSQRQHLVGAAQPQV